MCSYRGGEAPCGSPLRPQIRPCWAERLFQMYPESRENRKDKKYHP